jgi:glycosyltransferase involved in cell wall biosynthesis
MISVSVLIPAYNREQYLEETVRSVMKQTFSNIEIIIIDDASTDGTGAIAERLAHEDTRIRVIQHNENKFRSGALNTGLDTARSTYICFLDSDDCYLPNKLERQVAFLEAHPGIDAVYGDFETKYQHNQPKFVEAITSTERAHNELLARAHDKTTVPLAGGFIPSCSPLIRSSVFTSIRFDTTLRNSEDLDMWFQILGAGFRMERLPGSTYIYRLHRNQKSNDLERMRIARTAIDSKLDAGTYLRK